MVGVLMGALVAISSDRGQERHSKAELGVQRALATYGRWGIFLFRMAGK